ncbi:MAG TPA: hypothetical protein VF939_15750 [Puia sp.]
MQNNMTIRILLLSMLTAVGPISFGQAPVPSDGPSQKDWTIKAAKMFLQLPNDQWFLANRSDTGFIQYVFKRNAIKDTQGHAIVPAIMLYVDDAAPYKGDIVAYSTNKRALFSGRNLETQKTLIPSNKDFPLAYKNSIEFIASYSSKGLEHILYMVYIITRENKGIQLYMDMTKEIAGKYGQEFLSTLHSIREL